MKISHLLKLAYATLHVSYMCRRSMFLLNLRWFTALWLLVFFLFRLKNITNSHVYFGLFHVHMAVCWSGWVKAVSHIRPEWLFHHWVITQWWYDWVMPCIMGNKDYRIKQVNISCVTHLFIYVLELHSLNWKNFWRMLSYLLKRHWVKLTCWYFGVQNIMINEYFVCSLVAVKQLFLLMLNQLLGQLCPHC